MMRDLARLLLSWLKRVRDDYRDIRERVRERSEKERER